MLKTLLLAPTNPAPGRRFPFGLALRAAAVAALVGLGGPALAQTSTTLERWQMDANASPSAVATGVTGSSPTLQGLAISNSTSYPSYTAPTAPTTPATSVARGQVLAPNADGTGWSGTLDRTRYEEFTVVAATTHTLRVDSLIFSLSALSTTSGRVGVSWSTAATFPATPNEVTGGTLPLGGDRDNATNTPQPTAANGSFTTTAANATQVARRNNGPLVSVSGAVPDNTFRLALNGTTGVAVSAGQTLRIRVYFAIGSSSSRYMFLRQVLAKGQSTMNTAACTNASSLSVGSITQTTAQLTFTAPAGNTSYNITTTPASGSQSVTTGSATLTGLAPNTSYTANVQSVCSGGFGTVVSSSSFTTLAQPSTVLEQWQLTASASPTTVVTGVTGTSPTFSPNLAVADNSVTSGNMPGYSTLRGQAFAPTAVAGDATTNGSTPWPTGTLERVRYQEFTVVAAAGSTLRVDSVIFSTSAFSTANARVGVSYSTAATFPATPTEVSGGMLPLGGDFDNANATVAQPAGATGAFTQVAANATLVARRNNGPVVNQNTYRLALNGATGITVAAGQTLRVRLYYAVGTSSTPRFIFLRDVAAKGQSTPVCQAATSLTVSGVTATAATVSFTPASGNTGYEVSVAPTAGGTAQTQTVTGSSATFSGLSDATNYTASIRSNCAAGQGPAATVSFTTAVGTSNVVQLWRLINDNTDDASVRSADLTASTSMLQNLYTSNGTTIPAIASYSSQYGQALSPSPTGDGGGWNSTATPPGPGTNPQAGFYEQFTVTAAAGANPIRLDSLVFSTAFRQTVNGNLAVAYSLNNFASSTFIRGVLNTNSANEDVAQNDAGPNALATTYRLNLSGATGITLTAGQSVSFRFYYAAGSGSTGRYAFLKQVAVKGRAAAALPANLVVSSAQNVIGSYNNVTIQNGGTATLTGTLAVAGTLTVESGGVLATNCQPVTGAGSFTLQAGGELRICALTGLTTSGGPIQVTGARTYSTDASYTYNGSGTQATGNALPSQVRNLTLTNNGGLLLSQAVSITQVLRLTSGNLSTSGQTLTLLSSSTGTALLDNTGGTVNGTGTMQRAITSSTALGYRHYSSPVSNAAVSVLGAPTTNTSYNTSATPGAVSPFPTVFRYDQSRVGTITSTYGPFDQGWLSPAANETMLLNQGYTVNTANSTLVSFAGTFNNANQNSGALPRGVNAESGWQLLGNPYPSPLDWSTVSATQRPGMDAAMYIFESSGPYAGAYRTYTNGVGVTSLINAGQGYFVRTSTAGVDGAVNLTNANRVTTFVTQPVFGRGTTDTRPQLRLQVSGAGLQDETFVYFEAGATSRVDAAYDATKLPNATGLNLASLAGNAPLAINALPVLSGADVVAPLNLQVPQSGSFTFEVTGLANFGSTTVFLRDALLGTRQVLAANTRYAFSLASATAGAGRFSLVFQPANVTATQAELTEASVSLYPNPAHSTFTVLLPPVAGQKEVRASLLNALGQVVQTRTIALNAAGATSELDVRGLAVGIYALRLQAGAQVITRRVVVE